MATIPPIQSGLSGVQSGLQNINRDTATIASASTLQSSGNITEPLVNLINDKQQVQASAKIIEASNAMLGSILDIKV